MRYHHLTIVYWLPPTTYGCPVLLLVGNAPLVRILPPARGASGRLATRDSRDSSAKAKAPISVEVNLPLGSVFQLEDSPGEEGRLERTPAHPLAEVDSSEKNTLFAAEICRELQEMGFQHKISSSRASFYCGLRVDGTRAPKVRVVCFIWTPICLRHLGGPVPSALKLL